MGRLKKRAIGMMLSLVLTLTLLPYVSPAVRARAAGTADDVVSLARSQIGNSWDAYMSDRIEWCAYFVTWCLDNAGVSRDSYYVKNGNYYYVPNWQEGFEEIGRWHPRGTYYPKPGDLVIISTSVGPRGHIAIVESADTDGIYYIEGNNGYDRVGKSAWTSLANKKIYGYCEMLYSGGSGSGNGIGAPMDLGDYFTGTITHASSGRVVRSYNGDVRLENCKNLNTNEYTWTFEKTSDGKSYQISSWKDSKCLNVYAGLSDNGTNIWTYQMNGTGAQRWYLYDIGDGNVALAPAVAPSSVMDIGGSSGEGGVNIHLWSYSSGNANQMFIIHKNQTPTKTVIYNNHKYVRYDYSCSWREAKNAADQDGGHLVTINSSSEQDFIKSFINGSKLKAYWLGATDESSEGNFKWVTGESLSYKAWGSSQPDNAGGSEHYLGIWTDKYTWNDFPNTYNNSGSVGFIVEYDTAQSGTSGTYNNHQYKVVNNAVTAAQARNMQTDGWYLATITSSVEDDYVSSLISKLTDQNTCYYIGANDKSKEGTFVWENGETFSYAPWSPGEPTNKNNAGENENYLAILPNGKFNDISGTILTGYILEKDPVVEVEKVILDWGYVKMVAGKQQQISATVSPSNATNKTITWTSSNTKVATVSSSGLITSVAAGEAVITAKSSNGKTATCNVKIKQETVDVTSVSLNKVNVELETGKNVTLTATVSPSNATNKTITWSSSNTKVATVSSSGVVTAVAAGEATITAKTANEKTVICKVTVKEKTVEVEKIDMMTDTSVVVVGYVSTLDVIITPSNATNKTITWSSSDTKVATVEANAASGGRVTGVAAGTATITAKSANGKTATCIVTVKDKVIEVEKLTLNKSQAEIGVGEYVSLTASVTPSNATDKTVSWTSSNTSIAKVASNGRVEGVSAGTATITAKTSNGKIATCKIVVKKVVYATIMAKKNSIKVGETVEVSASITSLDKELDDTIDWSISDSSVATVVDSSVSSGEKPRAHYVYIQGKKEGKVTISASTVDGKIASCDIIVEKSNDPVVQDVKVSNIVLQNTSYSMRILDEGQISWSVIPKNATNPDVKFSSSNEDVVYVYGDGSFIATGIGETDISVTSTDGSGVTKKMHVVVTGKDISEAVVGPIGNQVYTGYEIKPVLTVRYEGVALKQGADYLVEYENNVSAGVASVTITGIGNYIGELNKSFTIERKSIVGAALPVIKARQYTGSQITPAITVKLDGKTLVKGTDYKVEYLSNLNVGTASIHLVGIGNYDGTVNKTFKILPKGTRIKSFRGVTKGITVTWNKQSAKMKNSRITGYQIQYSTKADFSSNKKLKTVSGYTKTAATITGLSQNKTYYIRVRTYKTIGGLKYYSSWSKTRTIKIK